MVAHTFNPRTQETEGSLSSRLYWATLTQFKRETEITQRGSQQLGSHTFKLSTTELEIGVMWLGRESYIRWEETGAQCSQRQQSEAVSLRMQTEDRVALLV